MIVVQAFRFQKELGQFTNFESISASHEKGRISTRSSLMHSLKRKSSRDIKRRSIHEDETRSKKQENEKPDGDQETEEENLEDENEGEEEEKNKDEIEKKKEDSEKEDSISSEFIFDRGSVRRTQRSLRMQAKLIRVSMRMIFQNFDYLRD